MRAWVLVAFVAMVTLIPRAAFATNFQFADRQAAYEACATFAASWEAANPRPDHPMTCTSNFSRTPTTGYQDYAACNVNLPVSDTSSCWASIKHTYEYPVGNNGCPVGYVWVNANHECFSAERCLAKPSVKYGLLNISIAGMKMCSDRCQFEARDGTDSNISTAGETLHTYVGGAYKPTGQPCDSADPAPQGERKLECVGIPGQSMCKRDDGKLCATASSGKMICWGSGETGEKGDGPLLQVRNAGSQPASPQTPPPPGDSFTQQGSAQPVSESINGGTTINTTITNYTTGSGVNAVGSGGSASGGSGSSGEPDDGSQGSGSGGSGGDNGDTTGLLGSIRDKLNSLYDGLTGDGQNHAGDGADPSDTQVWAEDEAVDGSSLDQSGWLGGGSTCPALWTPSGGVGIAAGFTSEPLPQSWCDFVQNCRLIFIAFATIAGIYILAKARTS